MTVWVSMLSGMLLSKKFSGFSCQCSESRSYNSGTLLKPVLVHRKLFFDGLSLANPLGVLIIQTLTNLSGDQYLSTEVRNFVILLTMKVYIPEIFAGLY